MSHKARRIATAMKLLSKQIADWEYEYSDDSDSENNAYTNGYFTPRPSDEAVAWYREANQKFLNYSYRLIDEVLN